MIKQDNCAVFEKHAEDYLEIFVNGTLINVYSGWRGMM